MGMKRTETLLSFLLFFGACNRFLIALFCHFGFGCPEIGFFPPGMTADDADVRHNLWTVRRYAKVASLTALTRSPYVAAKVFFYVSGLSRARLHLNQSR
jgi:hypothetical protein